jgi:hypothetical protein
MTAERDNDLDATVKMPQPVVQVNEELENIDTEKTVVREDWESTVIRRVAPRIAAMQDEIGDDDAEGNGPYGWETGSLRRLSQEVRK